MQVQFFLSFSQCNFLFVSMASSSSSSSIPRTIDEIFVDYCGRRTAVIRALTEEVGQFHELCDPGREELCLFGNPNDTWEVKQPEKFVPGTFPEPAPGINFGRDVLNSKDWLALVALHTNSWLLSLSFHYGSRLNHSERETLFLHINGLPTIPEAVDNFFKSINEKPAVARGSKSRRRSKRTRDGNDINRILQKIADMHSNEVPCGICGKKENVDTFWIACDTCNRWFHGICVNVSPEIAKKINKYKCPPCRLMRR